MGEPVEVRVSRVDVEERGRGLECWLSSGKAFLLIRPGTACESVIAEPASDGAVIRVLKLWPGNEDCAPLLCAEVVPPHSYLVEVSLDEGAGRVVFHVFKAVDCGGKGVDVVGFVGECVPGPQLQTPR